MLAKGQQCYEYIQSYLLSFFLPQIAFFLYQVMSIEEVERMLEETQEAIEYQKVMRVELSSLNFQRKSNFEMYKSHCITYHNETKPSGTYIEKRAQACTCVTCL